jgi:hypothetical protein
MEYTLACYQIIPNTDRMRQSPEGGKPLGGAPNPIVNSTVKGG